MTAVFLLLSLVACGDKNNDTGSTEGPDTETADIFEAGTFQFTNQAVDDQCLDGGFTVLFMPDGVANDWQNTIELPAEANLPSTYNITLQEPFSEMEVTVSSGGDGVLVIEEAAQNGVLFDEASYADCAVDLSVQANIIIVDADTVNGTATLSVVSSAGETCPAFQTAPCDIILDFTGSRQ